MFKSLVKSVFQSAVTRSFCTKPTIIPALEKYLPNQNQVPRQVWIENMSTSQAEHKGLMELHPDVFAVTPRIDVIHQNVSWQRKYRYVSFASCKVRSEVRGGGKKPWPQKGMGRARHGSIRSPLFRGGGKAHGPRSPTSHYFMLPFYTRVLGLQSTLSVKLAQDDLHIVDDLEIPTNDPEYIKQMLLDRKWGPSALFVDVEDIVPENIAVATNDIGYVNIMPAYGLNVYSMLKHDTLVLTTRAAEHVQSKILYQLNRLNTFSLTKWIVWIREVSLLTFSKLVYYILLYLRKIHW